MAEEKEVQAIAPEPSKKSPIILIVVIVVVALAAAVGISFFITQHMMANNAGDGGPSRLSHDPGVFIKLGDPKDGILVNVGGLKAGRFRYNRAPTENKPKYRQCPTNRNTNTKQTNCKNACATPSATRLTIST